MANKYNPFRPDKIATPGMFCGRYEELSFIDHCLLQTQNGNPQHFLVEGERGIGKSSVFLCADLVARGQIPTMKSQTHLDFIVVSISLSEKDDYYSLIKKITAELKREVDARNSIKAMALSALEFASRFEAGGIRLHRDTSEANRDEFMSCLQADLVAVISKLDENSGGILLLIDEADKAPPEASLGLFCKLLTEELTRRRCDRLCIGLAGLPSLLDTLRASHESSPRVFKIMSLKPLEHEERIEVMDAGLRDAHVKSDSKVQMTDEAKEVISNLSEGYPHFLQEFCYCAFEADEDEIIDREDVYDSLFQENGAFDQLGRKYFNQYYSAPSSDDYRKVLDTMAEHLDEWVSRAEIINESGLKQGTVDNALRALKGKNVIFQNEMKMGQYRLPTKSFAVWIKARKTAEEVASRDADAPRLFDRPDNT